jgi:hypothetical protein
VTDSSEHNETPCPTQRGADLLSRSLDWNHHMKWQHVEMAARAVTQVERVKNDSLIG